MTTNSRWLYWSLFAASEDDIVAFSELVQNATLGSREGIELEKLKADLLDGSIVAVSAREGGVGRYSGLCVFGVQAPSPGDLVTASILVFSVHETGPKTALSGGRAKETIEDELIYEMLKFCYTHGYERLHVYVPSRSTALETFLRKGFRISSTHYLSSDVVYGMEQILGLSYVGDPYDGLQIMRWVAKLLSIRIEHDTETMADAVLQLETLHSQVRQLGDPRLAFPVRIFVKPSAPDRDAIATSPSPTIVLMGREEAQDLQDLPHVAVLDVDELRQLTNSSRLSLALWPRPALTPSIEVDIRRPLFERFDDSRQNAFFDSGTYGNLLHVQADGSEPPHIFFIDYRTTISTPTLLGVGKVRAVYNGEPQALWQQWGQISSFEADGFRRYRSIKRRMTVIVFDELRRATLSGTGLPPIPHSWEYVPSEMAYQVARQFHQ